MRLRSVAAYFVLHWQRERQSSRGGRPVASFVRNVPDFGVIGVGKTDNTTAFQKALDTVTDATDITGVGAPDNANVGIQAASVKIHGKPAK